jgi:hypothetical protein
MSRSVEDTLLELLADKGEKERGARRTASPEDVARAVDAENWRKILPQVRSTAVGLARQGRVVILRKGKPADPEGLKGVYRLALPSPEESE